MKTEDTDVLRRVYKNCRDSSVNSPLLPDHHHMWPRRR